MSKSNLNLNFYLALSLFLTLTLSLTLFYIQAYSLFAGFVVTSTVVTFPDLLFSVLTRHRVPRILLEWW